MIAIITGAQDKKKTKTAKYLFENTERSALIDGDWLLAINPEQKNDEERLLRYKNIFTLAKSYHEGGFVNIFISFVYISDANLQEQIKQLKEIDKVNVFALTPTEEKLRERHASDAYKREGIESSININEQIKKLSTDETIDNSAMTVEEVAEAIRIKLELS